jgi:hypothetical protein
MARQIRWQSVEGPLVNACKQAASSERQGRPRRHFGQRRQCQARKAAVEPQKCRQFLCASDSIRRGDGGDGGVVLKSPARFRTGAKFLVGLETTPRSPRSPPPGEASALFDRGHRLASQASEGGDLLFEGHCLGRGAPMLQRVAVSLRSAAAGPVHPADAIAPHRRSSAL